MPAPRNVIIGNFPVTKRVSKGGHIVLCAHRTIIWNYERREIFEIQFKTIGAGQDESLSSTLVKG